MKEKFQLIFYDLRHQPVVTWVTLIGTMLSVFLVMTMLMLERMPSVPFAPESNRPRMMKGAYLHTENMNSPGDNVYSGTIGSKTVRQLYDNLDGVERVSFMQHYVSSGTLLEGPTADMVSCISRKADAEFFNIADHTLLKGRYYTKAEADALAKVAVLTESTARKIFGDVEPVGASFLMNHERYTCIGVIADHSELAVNVYGDVFLPTSVSDNSNQWGPRHGEMAALLLLKPGTDPEYIRKQVKGRYAALNTELAQEESRAIYHESPYTVDEVPTGSNMSPDPNKKKAFVFQLLIYLLVPAINLSSMLHSRMRRRVSELGVRRAFGCTRTRIISDILNENLIVTLAGGILGFILSIIILSVYTGFMAGFTYTPLTGAIPLGALINWGSVAWAFVLCLVLNIVSASLPAWQASRLNPVNAINERK